MKDERFYVYKILENFQESGKDLKSIRNKILSKQAGAQLNHSRILVLTNEIIRWESRLDLWLESALVKPLKNLSPKVKIILRIGVYELLLDEAVPDYAAIASSVNLTRQIMGNRLTGLVNAILRKLSKIDPLNFPGKRGDAHAETKWLSFPHWIIEKWTKQFGKARAVELCNYFNNPASQDIRLNLNKMSTQEFISLMDSAEIKIDPWKNSARFFRLKKGSSKVLALDIFKNGTISLQDRGTGAMVELLDPQPGDTVLDICAAPGTKTAYIAERMEGRGKIYASDINRMRLELGKLDAVRHASIIKWSLMDGSKDEFPPAQRILVDAPCTGTGVLGRRPDLRWRRKPNDVREMAIIQTAILNNISRFLKPDGILVYGTCSLENEENWDVVKAFLKLNPQFKVESGQNYIPKLWLGNKGQMITNPVKHNVDGMFAVRFRYK